MVPEQAEIRSPIFVYYRNFERDDPFTNIRLSTNIRLLPLFLPYIFRIFFGWLTIFIFFPLGNSVTAGGDSRPALPSSSRLAQTED